MNESQNKSLKYQYYLALIPYFGMLIIWLVGMGYVYKRLRKRLYIFIYYLLSTIPITFFSLIFYIIFTNFIVGKDTLMFEVLAYILSYFIFVCIALSLVSIEKGLIEKIENKKKILNN